tara:strand:+ start:366 stop:2243 length:1878 start_codon:yes stop_codon:yes gene_type:complete
MTGYSSLIIWQPIFTPILTLAFGLITFFSFFGCGNIILSIYKDKILSPWNDLASLIVGILFYSLVFQIIVLFKYFEYTSIIIFFTLCSISLVNINVNTKNYIQYLTYSENKFLLLIIISAIFLNIAMSIAPSTKIDDLATSMNFLNRIMADQQLIFYWYPWETSIVPNMTYQLIALPFYSLGLTNVMNIIGILIFIYFIIFFGKIINNLTKSKVLSLFFIASSIVGLYPITNLATTSTHSLMVLSTASSILLIILKSTKKIDINNSSLFLLISIFIAGMFISKIILIPLIFIIILWLLFICYKSNDYRLVYIPILVSILVIPSIAWTWIISGSPLGSAGISFFQDKTFQDTFLINMILDDKIFSTYRMEVDPLLNSISGEIGYRNVLNEILLVLLLWSPIIVCALFFCLLSFNQINHANIILLTVFLFQIIIIYLFLPYKFRHLGGLQYLPLAVCFIYILKNDNFLIKYKNIIIILFILPWLLIQAVYVYPFFSVNIGMENKVKFYNRYIALYKDYVELDRILEKKSEILVAGHRINSFYSPRKVIHNSLEFDISKGKQLYLFLVREGIDGEDYQHPLSAEKMKLLEKYKVYENSEAILHIFRTPFKKSKKGKIEVYNISQFIYN